jgi:hypothetical protein
MKKTMRLFVSFVLMIFLVQIANAANVGVIARLKDSTEQIWCLSVRDGSTAKDVLDATDLNLEWSGFGSLAYLLTVNGVPPDYANNEGWSFWHQNSNGDAFEESSVGFGGYTISPSGTSIGLSYSAYDPDNNYRYLTSPSFLPYDECISKLKIKDIKVYVDGKKESGADEDGGKIDVVPGSKLELKIEIENLYTDDEDIKIEDITVEGVLESIDGGDDISDEANDFNLNSESDKKVSLKFNIPLEVEDGDYDLTVTIEGENENGFSYSKEIEFEVEVDKEKHNIIFNKLKFFNDNVECGSSASLEVDVVNLGVNDETVKLAISNEELGINIQEFFELSQDPFDKDNSFSKTYKIILPSGISPGIYLLRADLFYGNDIESSTVEVNIKCEENVLELEEESKEIEETVQTQTVQTPKIMQTTANIAGAAVSNTAEEKNVSNTKILIISTIVAGAIILIAGIVLLVSLFRR